jgi:NDP-sugar pyrophosphorylase family protein
MIPLGGTGTRFKTGDSRFTKPKALVPVAGKPLLFHLIESLRVPRNWLLHIAYNAEYVPHGIEAALQDEFPNLRFTFCLLKEQTRGAAETLMVGLKSLMARGVIPEEGDGVPVISLDSDWFYKADILERWKGRNAVVSFSDVGTAESIPYSYVELDEQRVPMIKRIVEKEKISEFRLLRICLPHATCPILRENHRRGCSREK